MTGRCYIGYSFEESRKLAANDRTEKGYTAL
jgi:hypothetical protein